MNELYIVLLFLYVPTTLQEQDFPSANRVVDDEMASFAAPHALTPKFLRWT